MLQVSSKAIPFPHAMAMRLLSSAICDHVLEWFETEAPWQLRVESFYEQYEIGLTAEELPASLQYLLSGTFVRQISESLLTPLGASNPSLLEVNAHKLLPGQTIRIHNDYIPGAETHRALIQINRGWSEDCGGILMLFSSASTDDVRRLIKPLHASAFGFEISPNSFHAVSKIYKGERYTIVYSFRDER